jgi:hypothetical protein
MDRASSLSPGFLPLPRPLMTGEVLDAAFRLFRASLLRCLPYSGLTLLLLQLPTLYSMLGLRGFPGLVLGDRRVSHGIGLRPVIDDRFLVYAVVFLLGVLLVGALILRMQAVSLGERPRFRREIGTALKRWPSALIATVGGLIFPVVLFVVGSLVNFMFPNEVLFVISIPLLWPIAILAPALPAFWCDRLGPFAAIARSVRIARRKTWRIVGAIFTTIAIVLVFYVLSAVGVAMLAPMLGRADLFLIAAVSSMLWIVFGAIGLPFVLAVLIVAYEDLKVRDAERRGVPA